ncbi:MAG TPA: hypothetical protein DCM05_01975 [Elusimicrobia bacterium]|nr:hypothetical protein [Elusimicrobiota bacterium]
MVFGVQTPGTGQMGYACILGALGEMPALCVYRGAEGFDAYRRIQKGEFHHRPEEAVGAQNCLMAERALAISRDCADAYNLLAEEEAGSAEDALDLYRKAIEAGERALGPRFFKDNAGHFWGILETRPYMRARAALARCLWELKSHDEALGHYHEMLRLNPGDNQGIRYIVLSCLGELGRFDEMGKFMGGPRYKDDCAAEWLYTKALLAFVREGASAEASAALRSALKQNKHALDYLTGKKSIPRRLPDRITMGGEDEGYCYASSFLAAWKRVPGALEWLATAGKKFKKPRGAKETVQ